MSKTQENQNEEEIQIIIEGGNDNAEYLKNRKGTKIDYSKVLSEEPKKLSWAQEHLVKAGYYNNKKLKNDFIGNWKQELPIETENSKVDSSTITTMSLISNIFYGFSVLSIVGMFIFLTNIKILNDIEIFSIQFYIICSYFGSAFIFFSFGELFRVINRIDKKL